MLFAVFAKTFAITEGSCRAIHGSSGFRGCCPLERGLLVGSAPSLLGGVMLLAAVNEWRVRGFGRLDYAETMRLVVPGVTLAVLGLPDDPALFLPEPADDETAMMEKAAFDAYAADYDEALNRGLSLSGESKQYFARARIQWTASRLADIGHHTLRVLDYGCGTGDSAH